MKKKHPYATCPECEKPLRIEPAAVETFPPHNRPIDLEVNPRSLSEPCYASGWIVEDEDRLSGRWPR